MPLTIDHVVCRISSLWPTDPELWFTQIKNQFALVGEKTYERKFIYITGNMESKYVVEVRDILTRPPSSGKYEKLKTAVHTVFPHSKIRRCTDYWNMKKWLTRNHHSSSNTWDTGRYSSLGWSLTTVLINCLWKSNGVYKEETKYI